MNDQFSYFHFRIRSLWVIFRYQSIVTRLLTLRSAPLHYRHEIAFPKKDVKYSSMGNTAVLQSYLKHKSVMLLKRYIKLKVSHSRRGSGD